MMKVCALCGERYGVEKHHIFGASNRNKSEEDGLVIYLCAECHRNGRLSAHQSAALAKHLHEFGELMWLHNNPGKDEWDFMRRYGRNYLEVW